ncbi:MAG TPA: SDR family NAD(P)-dependent oxidoreductase [Verrucomicrobiae bacterium]|nr:SDR family NAD(P)-dependent oxidoreductase [Verrucomicrobiae bacterium]
MLLEGQVAVVTGGGRGIGRAIARKFAAEGAAVVVTARSESEIQQVASEIKSSGGKAAAVAADLAQESACEKIVSATRKAFGAIHILVNNAAIYGPVQPVEKFTAHDWDEVMAVNLRAPMMLSQLVLPGMYARGAGVILNISTVGAKMAFGLSSAYTASKAGLIGLTRVVAAEAARKGVRVNALCPGPVTETKMSRDLTQEFSAYFQSGADEALKKMVEGILQGRPQTAEEIASAALFLVSDQARAITGQTLNVDGGMAFY